MTGKIKVHIDPKGYDEKPSGKEIGGIKSRLQKDTSPSLVTLEELVQKVETGHSISPGIMEGMSAKDWKEQQLFIEWLHNREVVNRNPPAKHHKFLFGPPRSTKTRPL